MPQVDLSRAEFRDGSYQFCGGLAPWDSDKACTFYNTSQCLKTDCKLNHFPDQRSLRLVLDGPNICKNHLIGEHDCEFSKKTGRKCLYSHDLNKAALPLQDKEALKEHLILAEAWYNKVYTYDEVIATIELEKEWKRGAITEDEFVKKSISISYGHADALRQWYDRRENLAKKVLEQFRQTGKIEEADGKSETPVIDVSGLSGADILRLYEVEKPFGKQHERKTIVKSALLATDICDESYGWETEEEWSQQGGAKSLKHKGKGRKRSREYELYDMDPFSEGNMFELAYQGIKPWDDDAGAALMMLNGGFYHQARGCQFRNFSQKDIFPNLMDITVLSSQPSMMLLVLIRHIICSPQLQRLVKPQLGLICCNGFSGFLEPFSFILFRRYLFWRQSRNSSSLSEDSSLQWP